MAVSVMMMMMIIIIIIIKPHNICRKFARGLSASPSVLRRYVCICVCMYVCMCIYIYIYIVYVVIRIKYYDIRRKFGAAPAPSGPDDGRLWVRPIYITNVTY